MSTRRYLSPRSSRRCSPCCSSWCSTSSCSAGSATRRSCSRSSEGTSPRRPWSSSGRSSAWTCRSRSSSSTTSSRPPRATSGLTFDNQPRLLDDRRRDLADGAADRDVDDRVDRARGSGSASAGVAMGITLRPGALGVTLVLYAMPEFWFGLLMIMAFSVTSAIFPSGGMETAASTLTGRARRRRPEPPGAAVLRADGVVPGRVLVDHAVVADGGARRRLHPRRARQGRPRDGTCASATPCPTRSCR